MENFGLVLVFLCPHCSEGTPAIASFVFSLRGVYLLGCVILEFQPLNLDVTKWGFLMFLFTFALYCLGVP